MFGEYATVTRSDNGNLDCVGNKTQRTYRDVEIIDDTLSEAMPEIGDVGLVLEIQNGDYLWLGNLNQSVIGLVPGEARIHPGKPTGIDFLGLENNEEASIYRADLVTSETEPTVYKKKQEVSIKNNGDIVMRQIDADTQVTISSIILHADGSMDINSPGTINVTASTINLN